MHTTTSFQAFVAHLVDYAGMFPPSQLPLDEAVQNFAVFRRGGDAPLLGRMIVPATRLAEVDRDGELLMVEPPYMFAVIARGGDDAARFLDGLRADIEAIVKFRQRLDGNVAVDCVEARLPAALAATPTAGSMREFADAVARVIDDSAPGPLQPFYEVPLDERLPHTVAALVEGLAAHRAGRPPVGAPHHHATYVPGGVKLRCGGTAPAPSPEQVALVIEQCMRAEVPLKLTAGLHHAIRQPSRPGYPHGFVNLFAAGILAHAHPTTFDRQRLLAVIEDEQADHFTFDDHGFAWTTHRADLDQIRAGRKLMTSFGSCSFDDPRSDLRALGWLAPATA